ncbi:MAG: SDR family oxidoreductase [Spirochaetaceae bacterium]|nr:SDR family oxidoreductase [Spirochaetaceae bacterium]
MNEKTVLITGGAGFIGSHLCKRLLNENCRVICLDNFYTGRECNISELRANRLFSTVTHDVVLPYSFYADEIYNLACPASPPHYQRNPVETFKTSIFGALNALDLANKWNAKVFQSSTSEVYGDPLVHPQPETYWGHVNTVGIRSCYDEGKRGAETLFMDYHRQYGTLIKMVRIFNTYGPNMNPDDGRVVSNFIVQALNNEDITIYGTGEQTRSFCYVDDLIEGFCRMMSTADDVTGPVNLGNPGEFTMLELAEKVLSFTGSKSKLVFKPLPQDDPKQRKPDISNAKQLLDWQPKVPLDDGLKETIKYFKKVIK